MTDDIDSRIREHLAEQAQHVSPGDLDWVRQRSSRLRMRRGAAAIVAGFVVAGLGAVGFNTLAQHPDPMVPAEESATVEPINEARLPTFVVEDAVTLLFPYFHGEFAFDAAGCPFLQDETSGEQRPLYFPQGSTLEGATDGTRYVAGPDGSKIVTEGDTFFVGFLEYQVSDPGPCQDSDITGEPLFADFTGVVPADE